MSLRNVAVTIKGMQAEGKGAIDLEPRDDFVEDVVARGPTMSMDAGEEIIDRREALMATVDAALEVCRLTPRLVYVISRLNRVLRIFADYCRRTHRRGCTFPCEAEGGCRSIQGGGKAKGIFTGKDYMVERYVCTPQTPEWCTRTHKRYVQILPGGPEGQWLLPGWQFQGC